MAIPSEWAGPPVKWAGLPVSPTLRYLRVSKVCLMPPGQAPHITTEYSADSRYRTPRARVCLHIQKPKPLATIKNEIEKIHKLFDVYSAIHKR